MSVDDQPGENPADFKAPDTAGTKKVRFPRARNSHLGRAATAGLAALAGLGGAGAEQASGTEKGIEKPIPGHVSGSEKRAHTPDTAHHPIDGTHQDVPSDELEPPLSSYSDEEIFGGRPDIGSFYGDTDRRVDGSPIGDPTFGPAPGTAPLDIMEGSLLDMSNQVTQNEEEINTLEGPDYTDGSPVLITLKDKKGDTKQEIQGIYDKEDNVIRVMGYPKTLPESLMSNECAAYIERDGKEYITTFSGGDETLDFSPPPTAPPSEHPSVEGTEDSR